MSFLFLFWSGVWVLLVTRLRRLGAIMRASKEQAKQNRDITLLQPLHPYLMLMLIELLIMSHWCLHWDQSWTYRSKEECSCSRSTNTDTCGKVQSPGEVLTHRDHSRGIHQTQAHSSHHTIGQQQHAQAARVGAGEDGDGGDDGAHHTGHSAAKPEMWDNAVLG